VLCPQLQGDISSTGTVKEGIYAGPFNLNENVFEGIYVLGYLEKNFQVVRAGGKY